MAIEHRIQDQEAEEVVRLGSKLYDERFRLIVELAAHGQFIAIHVDSGDHSVARTSSAAIRALRASHPADGRIFVRRISNEPDYGMSMRILAGENARHDPAMAR